MLLNRHSVVVKREFDELDQKNVRPFRISGIDHVMFKLTVHLNNLSQDPGIPKATRSTWAQPLPERCDCAGVVV